MAVSCNPELTDTGSCGDERQRGDGADRPFTGTCSPLSRRPFRDRPAPAEPMRNQQHGREEHRRPYREDRDRAGVLIAREVDRLAERRDGPPDALLPSTTKNNQVGRTAQRPISTTISEVNDATASSWSARMPQVSSSGRSSRFIRGPSTSVKTIEAATARVTMKAVHRRRDSRPVAFWRTWKTVKKPTTVV